MGKGVEFQFHNWGITGKDEEMCECEFRKGFACWIEVTKFIAHVLRSLEDSSPGCILDGVCVYESIWPISAMPGPLMPSTFFNSLPSLNTMAVGYLLAPIAFYT